MQTATPSTPAAPASPAAHSRLVRFHEWLKPLARTHGFDPTVLTPVSGDASFRRYFRVRGTHGDLIIMDAPPPHEDCRPFIHVAGLLRAVGVNTPAILAQDVTQGFVLLSDLGAHNYAEAIRHGMDDARLQTLYRDAIVALVRMQHASTDGLPVCDQAHLLRELALFPEWYVQHHCALTLNTEEQAQLARCFLTLAQDNLRQARVLVHRDFHSPNLMVCTEAWHGQNPGVIDFQDAFAGPITYDLASLVMDARTTWEEAQQLDWAIRYWEAARAAKLPVDSDFADFHRACEWMGLQRNLRILGVFARLSLRDGKPAYLAHMPRVLAYVRQVTTRYQVFFPLARLIDRLQAHESATTTTPCAP